jgi:lipoprotein-releasing system permease protein
LKDKQTLLQVASFIARRIAFNQQRSFSRFIIRLSVAATAISVAVMIVTLAFTTGFQQTVSQKVFSFWGHIRVQNKQTQQTNIAEESKIKKNETLVQAVLKNKDVYSVQPFATKYAVLKTTEDIEGVLLKGVEKNYHFDHLQQFLKEGRWPQFNDSSYSREIVISQYTAKQLSLKLNDKILIYFIRPDGNLRSDKLTITGIYKTAIEEYDKTFAVGDIKLIQKLNRWNPDEIGGYEIFLKDYHTMEKDADSIYSLDEFPPSWNTKTIRDIYAPIFDWLNMQDTTRNVLIGFMTAVAVINLITCLIILVLERIRMIGILKAIGSPDRTIQHIFLQHSLIITVTGIFLGTLFGVGLCWLQQRFGFIKLDEDSYYMSTAAVEVVWWHVLFVAAFTFAVTLLILLIPSLIVKKIRPVQAIQFR